MRLLNFHIIGHPDFERLSWIDVGEGSNILAPETTAKAQTLLHVLQAVHPPYDCQRVHPFDTFPLYRSVNSVTRKVIHSKRTAVIAIYSASAHLVEKLAAIDPVYWEVDRVEIGRRRDYSRWMNFVEIPASARLSEIAKILQPLLAALPAGRANEFEALSQTLHTWPGTDRLKGERADWLSAQVRRLQALLPHSQQAQLKRCLQALALNEHFHRAKKLVMGSLPLFLNLPCMGDITLSNHGQLTFLADRLVERTPDKAALLAQIEFINNRWRALGVPVSLLSAQNSIRVKIDETWMAKIHTGSSAIDHATRMLQCVTILHRAVYGTDPIVLVDFMQFCKQGHRCENSIAQLRQLCGRFQCLIAPDENLLALCRQAGRANLVQSDQMRIVPI